MNNDGRNYERITQRVFDQILNQNGVKTINVQHDVVLNGKTTSHQIDVFWEFEFGGIRYQTIVQAKDWKSPVNQGELFKFKSVLEDLPGQPRGIFVTRAGYQDGAVQYASAHGIKLYEMREPLDKDWDGYIKTIEISLQIEIPEFALTSLDFDNEWLASEKKKLGLESFTHQIQSHAGAMMLVDINNNEMGSIADVMNKMTQLVNEKNIWVDLIHNFEAPSFIRTGSPVLPLCKLNAIKTKYRASVVMDKITIDAGEVVGFILKDILEDTRHTFDKNILMRN